MRAEKIMESTRAGSDSLGSRAIPALRPEQVRRFTPGSLRAKPVRRFDLEEVLSGLHALEGRTVLALDIGGDKIAASYYLICGGAIRDAGNVLTRYGNGGSGYLDALIQLAELLSQRMIPVGISFAWPIDGTRIIACPNLPEF